MDTKQLIKNGILALAIGLLSACPAEEALEQEGDSQFLAAALDSMQLAMGQDLDEEEAQGESRHQRRPGPKRLLPFLRFFAPLRLAKACIERHYDPALGSLDCSESEQGITVVSEFDHCDVGKGAVSAQLIHVFDSPETCAEWIADAGVPTEGSMQSTLESFSWQRRRGQLQLDSLAHQNYLGETIEGGRLVSFGESTKEVDILGFHKTGEKKKRPRRGKKRRKNRDDSTQRPQEVHKIDQSIRTILPLVIEGEGQNRTILSGTVVIDHNLKKMSSSHVITDLAWNEGCCHPISGNVEVQFTGARTGTLSVTFNETCGSITVSKNDSAPKTLNLSQCR